MPKVEGPTRMSQFRPISCCNVIYKCISKLIASRLKRVVASIVSLNQSAFIPKRSIGDNIMLAQAVCRDYHLSKGPARCLIKLDIHKAFDSLNWRFMKNTLIRLGFPTRFIDWIMKCITSGMYSVKVNGSLEGYFKGESGLRQGDALSPYLFVLAMEVFTSCINQSTASPGFKYHWRMDGIKLSHITFADDVLLFCKGEVNSVNCLMSGVQLFSSISGLKPNMQKSDCFFGNVSCEVIQSILDTTGLSQGSFPIRYLGLPLITGKLKISDCMPLVRKLCARIEVWTSIFLSYAGRLQLIKSVLSSI